MFNRFLRRSGQLNQLITSQNLIDNEKNQQVIKERYEKAHEIEHQLKSSQKGFTSEELRFLVPLCSRLAPNSKVLVVGGGCGREAYGFSKMGFHVTSLDFSEKATAEGKDTYSVLNNIKFELGNIIDWESSEKYELVYMSSCLINFFKGRKNRIKALQRIYDFLNPGGTIAFEADISPMKRWSRFDISSAILKWRYGNDWEPGDMARSFYGSHSTDAKLLFYHLYPHHNRVIQELKEVDFKKIERHKEFFSAVRKGA